MNSKATDNRKAILVCYYQIVLGLPTPLLKLEVSITYNGAKVYVVNNEAVVRRIY